MNRQLSAFDIYVIVSELQEIKDYFIEKSYQISKEEIIIKIKNPRTKEKYNLFIGNSELISLTQKQIPTPTKPSTFAMTLRKYLTNSRINQIIQHEFDRIIQINFNKVSTSYNLIIELVPKGNIILLDENLNIILPFKTQHWAHRSVKSKTSYIPPPSRINPFKTNKEEFEKILKNSTSDTVRTLASQLNLGGIYAEELCYLAKINKNKKTKELTKEESDNLFNSLQILLTKFKNKEFSPIIIKENNKPIDVLPFTFQTQSDKTIEKTDEVVKALDAFIEKETIKKIDTKYEEELEKLKRKQKQQTNAIKSIKEKITQKKHNGEIIYLHFQEVEQLINQIKTGLELKQKTQFIENIQKNPIVKKFNPTENTLIVTLTDTNNQKNEIKIDFRKTIQENAENFYDHSKKQLQKFSGAEKALIKTNHQIKEYKQKNKEQKILEEKKQKTIIQKTYWFERFHWFISSNNNLVIGGKDSKTNDQIVKKYLKNLDRYAHADIHGAPSVIIKNKTIDDKAAEITEQVLKEACIFSACYSKSWKQFTEAQAYWVLPEQVSKTPQSGEFVPKGAFIIRGQRNYYKFNLELGIGLIEIDGIKKIIGAPISAIEKHCKQYIIIKPGGNTKTQTAQTITKLLNTSIDNINKVLPAGNSSIIKTIGFQTNEDPK
jgi:predicted ribosome quality control (RQC) complex YloA/Tae2 family protein